jgi:ADP-heptose:LPS heptosyltransferase
MENILLIRLKSIGDVLFTLPAVNAVRAHYPGAKITFLTSQENAPLLKGFQAVDEILPLDRRHFHSGNPLKIIKAAAGLLSSLRRAPFSLAFDFQGFGETELLAWWSGAPQRWGIVYQPFRGWAYTGISLRQPAIHPADWNLELLRAAGLNPGLIANEYVLPDNDLAAARDYFTAQGLDGHRPTLFLQPFTSSPTKNWPLANFIDLARHWHSAGGQIIFGGGPAERIALKPARAAGFMVAAGTSLAVTAGLMKLSTVIVGADTGVLHLAVAMKKRVIMLMRSNEPGHCIPYQHRDWTVIPRSGTLMETITLGQVIAAVEQGFAEQAPTT